MQTLNFFPYYEPYLRDGRKTTTFRLGQPIHFLVGAEVLLTLGWDDKAVLPLHQVTIEKVYTKQICQLNALDFDGESPDCQSPETSALVLGAIYRKVLSLTDQIWVVKFSHKGISIR